MSNWYTPNNGAWYAPLRQSAQQPAAPQAAQQPEPKKKKSRGWIWAVVSVAGVLALIVATSLLFPGHIRASAGSSATLPDSNFGQFIVPPSDSDDDGMPDDYGDFFSSFYTSTENEPTKINIPRAPLPVDFTCSVVPEGEELSLQELYRRCSNSIVGISGYVNGETGYSWGTGVILSENGLILTNTHVIADCDRAVVTLFDDREYEALLVGADSISDIAVLKIDAKGLTPAVFGDSSGLEVGDRVAAIGNPLGEQFRLTMTDGIISGIERGVNYKGHSMNLLQTNTAINEGNSGGPLFNMSGQVIGITNMKMMSSYSSIEGIGFAIPSATVAKIINLLVRDGSVNGRPSIGITIGPIPDSAKEYYNLPSGLYITAVAEGSDAAAKGIRPNDILIKVNGVEVSTTAEVAAMNDELQVGDMMTFTIWRDGEIFDVDVMLVDTNDIYG